jgi:hypothetical protein
MGGSPRPCVPLCCSLRCSGLGSAAQSTAADLWLVLTCWGGAMLALLWTKQSLA